MKAIRLALCLGAVTAVTLLPAAADAGNCGCYKALKSCLNKTDASSEACTDNFETCITACKDKKECVKECVQHKKEYKQACKTSFKETECPLKGKEAKVCKKTAKRKKNRCLKVNKTVSRICKSKCKRA
ncbi:MAG: hypothetical protein QNJ97_16120 [Myxococcota bacterium]|nr:hypothetical protein [Myxococcota bacterium]